ncbi:MAG: DUF3575 domain-containing protein [Muribaculaceae bacterium]|nr:DUF3575 domain-containing protein [Muribaculaceae bacterium]
MIKKLLSRLIILVAILATGLTVKGQTVGIKTNLLYDATSTVNLGVEVEVAPRWSLDISGNLNAWNIKADKYMRHWFVQPEARYWFCNPFQGHFLGFHGIAGQYNVGHWGHGFEFLGTDFKKLADSRFQGWFIGAGIAYGYSWILSKHWNIEAEIGFGYAYTRFDRYPCAKCGTKLESNKHHNYVGPTKAALNLIYVF